MTRRVRSARLQPSPSSAYLSKITATETSSQEEGSVVTQGSTISLQSNMLTL